MKWRNGSSSGFPERCRLSEAPAGHDLGQRWDQHDLRKKDAIRPEMN